MPRTPRTRPVTAAAVDAYLRKAEEFLEASEEELAAGRTIAATSLAIHAAINAADVVTGTRLGRRAAGQDHDQVLTLLTEAGPDGGELEKELVRLLPLKTRAEYDPDGIATSRPRRRQTSRPVRNHRPTSGHAATRGREAVNLRVVESRARCRGSCRGSVHKTNLQKYPLEYGLLQPCPWARNHPTGGRRGSSPPSLRAQPPAALWRAHERATGAGVPSS